jgi:isopentenyl phosphate kinase
LKQEKKQHIAEVIHTLVQELYGEIADAIVEKVEPPIIPPISVCAQRAFRSNTTIITVSNRYAL